MKIMVNIKIIRLIRVNPIEIIIHKIGIRIACQNKKHIIK